MLESRLIWINFQSNSTPLAPVQNGKNLKTHYEFSRQSDDVKKFKIFEFT